MNEVIITLIIYIVLFFTAWLNVLLIKALEPYDTLNKTEFST